MGRIVSPDAPWFHRFSARLLSDYLVNGFFLEKLLNGLESSECIVLRDQYDVLRRTTLYPFQIYVVQGKLSCNLRDDARDLLCFMGEYQRDLGQVCRVAENIVGTKRLTESFQSLHIGNDA